MWAAMKKKLLDVDLSLNADHEQVTDQEVDHDLDNDFLNEAGGSADPDHDQLESVGQYSFPIGPILESAMEDEQEENDAGDSYSDPFWIKTCYICGSSNS